MNRARHMPCCAWHWAAHAVHRLVGGIATDVHVNDADSVLDHGEFARGDFDLEGTVAAADPSLLHGNSGPH